MRRFVAFVLNNSFDQDFRSELENFFDFHVRAVEVMIKRAVDNGEISVDINPRVAAWIFVGGYFTLILVSELDTGEFGEPGFMDDIMRFLLR